MPDVKPENTEQPQSDTDKVQAGIVAGLKAALPDMVKEISAANRPVERTAAPQPVRQAAPILEDVSDEELDQAQREGLPISKLLRKREAFREAKMQQQMDELRSAGGAAINSAVRQAANNLPYYKRYQPEIDEMVNDYCQRSGAVATFESYEQAHKIVKANHFDELVNEVTEEKIRKSREPAEDFGDIGSGASRRSATTREPATLDEWFTARNVDTEEWKRTLRRKERTGQGGSPEVELRKMGYTGGFKQFAERNAKLSDIEIETDSSFYLDRDFDKKTGQWIPERGNKNSLEIDI